MPGIVTAPAPARLIERGKFALSVWTSVLLDKFLYGHPIHRLLQDLADHGLNMVPGTLTGGLKTLAPLFAPMEQAFLQKLRGTSHWHAMKPGAVLVNVARGSVVDQDAVVVALRNKHLGAAFLDVTDPEPLPAGHLLWSLDNAHISMHLSGRSQSRMFERAGQRFLDNLARFRAGETLQFQVDLDLGY